MHEFELDIFDNIINDENKIINKRPFCYDCKRPQKVCWCNYLPNTKITINTKVTILQHPYEETRKIQTAPILSLAFSNDNIAILKGRKFGLSKCPELFDNALSHGDVALLYPCKDAIPIDTLTRKPKHLVVLDGTWHQAKGMYLGNKWLHNLPKVMVSSSNEISQRLSEFVIRTQPNENCISTVEAVGRALLCLEDEERFNIDSYEALMAPLRYLCQIQLNHGAVCHAPKTKTNI